MSPLEWRTANQFSQEKVATLFGVTGANPARTWQRWESGERSPPIAVVSKLESLSDGKVTARSWLDVRNSYLSKQEVSA